jgi:hypothetical protein
MKAKTASLSAAIINWSIFFAGQSAHDLPGLMTLEEAT